jgi:hypothetical protein
MWYGEGTSNISTISQMLTSHLKKLLPLYFATNKNTWKTHLLYLPQLSQIIMERRDGEQWQDAVSWCLILSFYYLF